MSKEITTKKFAQKFAETINCKIEDSVCVNFTKTEGAMYIAGKRCPIDSRLFISISPEGKLEILNPDNVSFVIKPKYDEDFTAYFSFDGEVHKFSWKHPYDLGYIFIGIFKSDDIITYVTVSPPQSSGNLSGVFLDFGYKGSSYQKVLELASYELSMIIALTHNAGQYDFEKFLKNKSPALTTDATCTMKGGD